jgi:RHS repeat-associated protein
LVLLYPFDAFGNLAQVVMPNGDVIQYVIDGQNRRIARKLNGRITNKWLYAGQLTPIAELDSADNVIARFSGGYMNKNDTIYQIITDHLGSPRLVVNVSTGAIMERIDYDEFGNVVYDSNPGFQPFGFAGGLYDTETKLVRFGARDYDAETGRWTTKDPVGFGGRLSNLYEYIVNDPLNRIDRKGKQTVQVGGTVMVNAFGGSAMVSVGVAVDAQGNWGFYGQFGYGGGVGAHVATGITVGASNASTIEGLGGKFYNASGGAGTGYDVQGETFIDPCHPVAGGGASYGAGLGEGGAVMTTDTGIFNATKAINNLENNLNSMYNQFINNVVNFPY